MVNEIKRYELAEKNPEKLKQILEKMGFHDGSWQKEYKGKKVMSMCYRLISEIELHVTFDLETMQWDDFKDTLVLDDAYCQPYTPFYEQGSINYSFRFLHQVIKAYNSTMDSLVRNGILSQKKGEYNIHGVVRDNVPVKLEDNGYEVTLAEIEGRDKVPVLCEKLIDEVKRFKESRELDDFIDVLELVDVITEKCGVTRESVEKTMAKKRKDRGSYKKCNFVEKVEVV